MQANFPSEPSIISKPRNASLPRPASRQEVLFNSLPSSPAAQFLSKLWDIPQVETQVGDYTLKEHLGRGSFAQVRRVAFIDPESQETCDYADKIYPKSTQICAQVEREVMIWKQLRHPNIVYFKEAIEGEQNYHVICEIVHGESMLTYLNSQGKVCQDIARQLFKQLFDAVFYLHDVCNLAHCDLKLENMLIDKNMNLKLCDFGLSQYLMETMADGFPRGSLHYCAPEEFLCKPYDLRKSDGWSCGVSLYIVLSGRFPFDDAFAPRLVMNIRNGEYERLPATISTECRDVVDGLLVKDPLYRISLEDATKHIWFQ